MAMNHRKRVTKTARPRSARFRAPARRVAEIRELERTHIARELHDQVGPILSLARLDLEALHHTATTSSDRRLIASGKLLLDQAIERVRTLSFELRPALVEEVGLTAAVASYARRAETRGGMTVHAALEPVDGLVSKDVATACFRVLQEAVTNAIRHAHGQRLEVQLAIRAGALELQIADDGRGFDLEALNASRSSEGRMGLLAMRERAVGAGGTCTLQSALGIGTVVRARFPLHRSPRAQPGEADPHPARR
jgi:signal transduction histidine kinase